MTIAEIKACMPPKVRKANVKKEQSDCMDGTETMVGQKQDAQEIVQKGAEFAHYQEALPVARMVKKSSATPLNADDVNESDILGLIVNHAIINNQGNTSSNYTAFLNYVIDHFSDSIINFNITNKLIRPDKNDPAFGTDAIKYPKRILLHRDLYYNSHSGNLTKKNRMIGVANELRLQLEFLYE